MAIIKGKCKNYGNCDLADNNQIQEVDELDFVCPECGKPLEPYKEPKTAPINMKLLIIIAAIVLVLVGIALLLFHKPKVEATITLAKHSQELVVGEYDTLTATIVPEETSSQLLYTVDGNEYLSLINNKTGIVKALKKGEAMVKVCMTLADGTQKFDTCVYRINCTDTVHDTIFVHDTVNDVKNKPTVKTEKATTSTSKNGKLNLGYAKYEGECRNGKPHGNGVMYFNYKQIIPGTADCIAVSGEKVIGAWREGRINMGTWYCNNGNQIVIKAGQRYDKDEY